MVVFLIIMNFIQSMLSPLRVFYLIYAKTRYSQSKKSLTFETQYTVHVQLC